MTDRYRGLETLVPAPAQWTSTGDWFELPANIRVCSELPGAVGLFDLVIGRAAGVGFEEVFERSDALITVVRLTSAVLPAEGYELEIDGEGVVIRANDHRGLVWATQTLRQLMPVEAVSARQGEAAPCRVPTCRVVDAPRYGWRGILLDVARWYQPIEFLYRFVDLASFHKLNVLHLHLTDDQGWRFEVKRHPRLTSVGAWRSESRVGHWRDGELDGTPHGGYYTQDELRGLVAYAESLGVTVVPEVDLPGHTQAAIAAYPALGNAPEVQLPVETAWGVITHVLNFEESTVRFFYDVFDELMDVFPSLYIHIGGDECPTEEWAASERVTQLLQERGLPDVGAVEPWILDRISTYLRSRGRIPIGWDEILDGATTRDVTAVMSWRGEEGGLTALRLGRDVVLAPNTHLYFDQYQSPVLDAEPIAADGVITLEKVFGYAPAAAFEPSRTTGSLLGIECALWAEHLPDPSHIEYMMFPRVPAYSDIAWGNRHEDRYSAYLRILERHEDRLAALGVARRLTRANRIESERHEPAARASTL